MGNVKRVIAQAHHRNGVGGAPFTVTIFESNEAEGTFLAISVPGGDSDERVISRWDIERETKAGAADPVRAAKLRKVIEDFRARTAVVRLEDTIAGNIAFAEGNSWRGADHYGDEIAAHYREQAKSGAQYPGQDGFDPFDNESYIEDLIEEDQRPAKRIIQIEEDIRLLVDERGRLAEAIDVHEARLEEALKPEPVALTDEEQEAIDLLSGNPLFADLMTAATARVLTQ
jgi:hypothetical protein